MRTFDLAPRAHFFVCANHREAGSPLGPGCGAAGDGVYDAFKEEVARRGAVRSVWVTKTHCLGVCPRHGCTVAVYPEPRIWSEVTPGDVPGMVSETMSPMGAEGP